MQIYLVNFVSEEKFIFKISFKAPLLKITPIFHTRSILYVCLTSFYTVRKREICATRKDEWVRKILNLLRYETQVKTRTLKLVQALWVN